MRTHRTATVPAALTGLLLLVGCTGGDGDTSVTPTTAEDAGPTVSSAPASSTPTEDDGPTEDPSVTEDTTEDASATEDTTGEATEDPSQGAGEPEESGSPSSAVPEGSGCTPGDGALPDGLWYGSVTDADATSVELDLMCFYLGEEADRAAAEDGEQMVPVPNGYYIRNDDPGLRTTAVAPDARVLHYPTGDPGAAEPLDFDRWAELVQAGEVVLPGVWLTIDGRVVVAVEEQWTP